MVLVVFLGRQARGATGNDGSAMYQKRRRRNGEKGKSECKAMLQVRYSW